MTGILCKLCIIRETNTGAYKYCKNLDWGLDQDYTAIITKNIGELQANTEIYISMKWTKIISSIILFGSCLSCNQWLALVDTMGKEVHEGMKNVINAKSNEVVLKKIIKFWLIKI